MNTRTALLSLSATSLALLAPHASAQASFQTLGDGSTAYTVSSDGTLILGADNVGHFVWLGGNKTYIPGGLSVSDMSDDGNTIYGMAADPNGGLDSAAIWTAATDWVLLGGLPGHMSPANEHSTSYQISGDGTIAVGLGWRSDFTAAGFRYDSGTGVVELPQMGPNSSRASAISRDGMLIGGFDEADTGPRRAVIWDENLNSTLLLVSSSNPEGIGEVLGINHDGSVVVGSNLQESFIWTPTGGVTLSGPFGNFDSNLATATSDDGEVVVGLATTFPFDRAATIWTPDDGMQSIKDVLIAYGVQGLDMINLDSALAVSADGTVIVGWGFDFGGGSAIGWVATLPRCGAENFCSSTANSTGSPAEMGSNGMVSITDNALTLSAGPVPNDNGMFYFGEAFANGGNGTPFGNGLRCVANPIFRLGVLRASGNAFNLDLDLDALPTGAPDAMPGVTWFFQAWFRDTSAAGAFFDLSDGLAVTWCP